MADSSFTGSKHFRGYREQIVELSGKVIFLLLTLLTAVILLAVVVGVFDLIRYIPFMIGPTVGRSYQVVREFLGYILLLVIGLEIATALIRQKAATFLNVMIYGVTMKVLIRSEQVYELLFGALALGVLFLIKCYLLNPVKSE